MQEDKRNHRIKADYGTPDYYNYFVKNNPELADMVSKREYGEILKEFNGFQRERLSNKGAHILFPSGLGYVELGKVKTEVKIDEEGKVVNNLPVDWKRTRELWRTHSEAKEKRTLIKFTNEHTEGYTFKVYYVRKRAKFKNKSIYRIRFNRQLKRDLSKSIFAGKIDAFLK